MLFDVIVIRLFCRQNDEVELIESLDCQNDNSSCVVMKTICVVRRTTFLSGFPHCNFLLTPAGLLGIDVILLMSEVKVWRQTAAAPSAA